MIVITTVSLTAKHCPSLKIKLTTPANLSVADNIYFVMSAVSLVNVPVPNVFQDTFVGEPLMVPTNEIVSLLAQMI